MALIVPHAMVKTVKDRLEAYGKLDKQWKIRPYRDRSDYLTSDESREPPRYLVPTTAFPEIPPRGVSMKDVKTMLLAEIGLENDSQDIGFKTNGLPRMISSSVENKPPPSNKLALTIYHWLRSVPRSVLLIPTEDLVFTARWSYTIYSPLLLLPAATFAATPWSDLFSRLDKALLDDFYASIGTVFNTTHLALDGPIPSTTGSSPNILRSPTNLTPLYGDFGPAFPSAPEHIPTSVDFENAFWCSTSQNGIVQTWAPRFTMFSRGNLSEKKRVLELPTLKEGLGGNGPGEISAVDLYAGIGYFAFSYLKAGVGKVFCWELNPWSIEGMRRGAEGNGWKFRKMESREDVMDPKIREAVEEPADEARLEVFAEKNERAGARMEQIRKIRKNCPPIRHVNCGLLPTSERSWTIAVQVLDPQEGGWIHAHENVKAGKTERRKDEFIEKFRKITHQLHGAQLFNVGCSHVEIVKSYGPGIKHVVFDIAILPSGTLN